MHASPMQVPGAKMRYDNVLMLAVKSACLGNGANLKRFDMLGFTFCIARLTSLPGDPCGGPLESRPQAD